MKFSALVAFFLLLPSAGAFELSFSPLNEALHQYQVAPGIDAIPMSPGQAVSTKLTLTDEGDQVAYARIILESGAQIYTNSEGVARYSFFENNGTPHLQTERVKSVEFRVNQSYENVEGVRPSLSVLWTHIYLRITAPEEGEIGEPMNVEVEPYWSRTGQLISGLDIKLESETSTATSMTDADGVAHFLHTPSQEGPLIFTANIPVEAWPNGVRPDSLPTLTVLIHSDSSDSADDSESASGSEKSEKEGRSRIESGPAPVLESDQKILTNFDSAEENNKPFELTTPTPNTPPAEASRGAPAPGAAMLSGILVALFLSRRMIQ